MNAVRYLALGGLALLLAAGACSRKARVQNRLDELEQAFAARQENAELRAAVAAIRTNDQAEAVLVLQSVRRTPGLTAPQLMAAQNAMSAIMADLTARADRGDQQAKAALAQIERSRSQ